MSNLIHFYWDGPISETRLQILRDSIYSTRVWNPNHTIILWSNSLDSNILDIKFKIDIKQWDISFFDGLPMSNSKKEGYLTAHPRDFSDLFRLILLYKFGGTYIDTDDLGINPISETPNLICRSYDPHTSFYNKIDMEGCVPGWVREIEGGGYNTFPRNDCWQNWTPYSNFIHQLLWHPNFKDNDSVIWICGDWSWQSLTNETCIKNLETYRTEWNYGLTLLYLFEDFISASSVWDRCSNGGEMCEIWNDMPAINEYQWGFYKATKEDALDFYNKVIKKYPYLSHMWLHSKDEKKEWFLDLDSNERYSVSTWIYDSVKEKINEWK